MNFIKYINVLKFVKVWWNKKPLYILVDFLEIASTVIYDFA